MEWQGVVPEKLQTDQRQQLREKYHLIWRAAALTLILMAGYIWWSHNFGEGLAGVPVLATLTAAFSFAMGLLEDSQKNEAKKWFARTLLSPIVLVLGFLAVFFVLCSRAPVILVSGQIGPLHAKLSPVERGGNEISAQAEKGQPARFRVWTTPLGRAFTLKVTGYAPKTIEVAAPAGLTLNPDRDLIPQISLLLRPTPDGMQELASGGTLHVYRQAGGTEKEIAKAQPHSRSSLLIGAAPVPLPRDLMQDWSLELAAQKETDISRANQLLAWKSPVFVKLLSPTDELTAHQKLHIVIVSVGEMESNCGSIDLPDVIGGVADLPLHRCDKGKP